VTGSFVATSRRAAFESEAKSDRNELGSGVRHSA